MPVTARAWHIEGRRRQEACVSGFTDHENISVDQLAFNVGEHVPGSRVWCGTLYVVCSGPDLVLTNMKLLIIHIITTDACLKFGATYSLINRQTECGTTVDIWTRTTAWLPMIRRTPRRISQEWLFCPALKIWPRRNTKQLYGSYVTLYFML